MTSISKNVYSDKIADIAYSAYHRTIKMKPIYVKSSTYNDLVVENNDKYPYFEVSDYVRISRYENLFPKGCTSNWSEKVSVPWTYAIRGLNNK